MNFSYSSLSTWTTLMTLGCLLLHSSISSAQLTPTFYDNTCPSVFTIVRDTIVNELRSDPRIAASILRLHFHDCFVNGCDASILLDNTTSFRTEKDAAPNANSARGFPVIDRMKAAVETACPRTVSCADILTIAAQQAVNLAGGPSWRVPLGRRDSLQAFFALANTNLPAPFFTLPQLKASFQNVGLDRPSDLVALSGGHTFGKNQCQFIMDRLYNFSNTGLPDPTLNTTYLQTLRGQCPRNGNQTVLVDFDLRTPTVFDNKYYVNLNLKTCLDPSSSSKEEMEKREDGGILTYDGRYVMYNVLGNIFELSSKYIPPIEPIGRGAYGIVCCATNSETNEEVAIKKIANAFDNRVDAKRTLREIKLLSHMDHDNVIKIKDIIELPEKERFEDVYIVYELMDTDLHQIIRSTQTLTDDHCQYFLYQILRGLKYIHSANVLHRDLKPSNLVLNTNCDLKICDFGLARTSNETEIMTEYVVTRWYRAPELLLNSSEYTGAIDIWSVGCIFMEILRRETLFPGKDYVQQLKLITELLGSPDDSDLDFLRSDNARKYVKQLPHVQKQSFREKFPNISPMALDLAEKMLVFDPSKRITVDEALKQPYLASLHEINEEPTCPTPFSFDFEETALDEQDIKELVWRESLHFKNM